MEKKKREPRERVLKKVPTKDLIKRVLSRKEKANGHGPALKGGQTSLDD